MNEEQLIATLQACYFGDKGAFNKMLKEYKLLQHNWNELKKWLEEYLDGARSGLDSYDCGIGDCLDDVLKKISELEEGGNNEC